MNFLLNEIFRMTNRNDVDDYAKRIVEKVRAKELHIPLYIYLEAAHLYNMYLEAFQNEEVEGFLYPYKLSKIIEIANSTDSSEIFKRNNRLYVYNGALALKELDGVLDILIKYANVNFLIKLVKQVIPLIKDVSCLENMYIALAVCMFMKVELPPKIGDRYTVDYMKECSALPFYADARRRLKKLIALLQLPPRAKAMYFQLPTLYKGLENAAIFDFGVVSLDCFKIIEISVKEIMSQMLKELSNEQIYEILPAELKDRYQADSFKIERLEIGKIYYILLDSFKRDDELSKRVSAYFGTEELLNSFIAFLKPEYIKKYRNAPAHGEYLPQELADEALKILDSFINEALYALNNRRE